MVDNVLWLWKLHSQSWNWKRSSIQPIVGDRLEAQREVICLSPHDNSMATLRLKWDCKLQRAESKLPHSCLARPQPFCCGPVQFSLDLQIWICLDLEGWCGVPDARKGQAHFISLLPCLIRNHSAFLPFPTSPSPRGPCTCQKQTTVTFPPPSQRKQILSDKRGFQLSVAFYL